MLEQMDVIFDTRKLLELEFRVVDLKFHIGTYFYYYLLYYSVFVIPLYLSKLSSFAESLMAMSQKDMLKRARQLIKQKTTIVGASPSAPPPRADLHEKISEPNPEPLTRKFKPRGKKIIEATS